jgi:hypothetical protein
MTSGVRPSVPLLLCAWGCRCFSGYGFAGCGNDRCEYGEECQDELCSTGCAADCPRHSPGCPVGLNAAGFNATCSGRGSCMSGSSICICYDGHAGLDCGLCAETYMRLAVNGPCMKLPGSMTSCNDGELNGNEVEVDCGGPNCQSCSSSSLEYKRGKLVTLIPAVVGCIAAAILICLLCWHHQVKKVTKSLVEHRQRLDARKAARRGRAKQKENRKRRVRSVKVQPTPSDSSSVSKSETMEPISTDCREPASLKIDTQRAVEITSPSRAVVLPKCRSEPVAGTVWPSNTIISASQFLSRQNAVSPLSLSPIRQPSLPSNAPPQTPVTPKLIQVSSRLDQTTVEGENAPHFVVQDLVGSNSMEPLSSPAVKGSARFPLPPLANPSRRQMNTVSAPKQEVALGNTKRHVWKVVPVTTVLDSDFEEGLHSVTPGGQRQTASIRWSR